MISAGESVHQSPKMRQPRAEPGTQLVARHGE